VVAGELELAKIARAGDEDGFVCKRKYFEVNARVDFEPMERF
jgi:hypothetical protein